MDAPVIPILCKAIEPHIGKTLDPELAAQITAQVAALCYPGPVDFSGIEPWRVGSYTLQCERFADALPELRALHAEHWAETETHRRGEDLNPDYTRMVDFENMGRFLCTTARHTETGQLVGNFVLYLNYSAHTQRRMATEDTLFVSKPHRRGRLGIMLIRFAEHAMRKLDVDELIVTVKKVNSVGQMIQRMGYAPVGDQFVKFLQEPDHVLVKS